MKNEPRPPYFAYFVTNLWWIIPFAIGTLYVASTVPFLEILLGIALLIGVTAAIGLVVFIYFVFMDFYDEQELKIKEYKKKKSGGY